MRAAHSRRSPGMLGGDPSRFQRPVRCTQKARLGEGPSEGPRRPLWRRSRSAIQGQRSRIVVSVLTGRLGSTPRRGRRNRRDQHGGCDGDGVTPGVLKRRGNSASRGLLGGEEETGRGALSSRHAACARHSSWTHCVVVVARPQGRGPGLRTGSGEGRMSAGPAADTCAAAWFHRQLCGEHKVGCRLRDGRADAAGTKQHAEPRRDGLASSG